MFKNSFSVDDKTNTVSISFDGEFTDKHLKLMQKFQEVYEIDHILFHPNKKKKLKPRKERVCSFCNRREPEVTFKKTAHMIPQLMGNKNLVSDQECDTCNQLFGTYEDHLANFIGISRTISFLRGEHFAPKYKSPDKTLTLAQDEEAEVPRLKLVSEGMDNIHFTINESEKELVITAIKHTYVPIKVFKSILRIAYSLIPPEEKEDYETTRRIIMSDEHDEKLKNNFMFKLFGFFSPGPAFPDPMVFFAKKKLNIQSTPSRTMVIYFQNYIYQIFIPYGKSDEWMFEPGRNIDLTIMPPFIDKTWIETYADPKFFSVDLSDNAPKKKEEQKITLVFDSVAYNVSTK